MVGDKGGRPPVGEVGADGKSKRAPMRLGHEAQELVAKLADRLLTSRSALMQRAAGIVLERRPSVEELAAFEPRRPYGQLAPQFIWQPGPGQAGDLAALAGERGREVQTLIRWGVREMLIEEGLLHGE